MRFDLSLENRRATENAVCSRRPRRCARPGLGLKAATITPEGADDVGSPNRILREAIDGKVIVRTGRRIPGVTPGRRRPPPDLGLPDGGRRRLRRRAVARGRRRRRARPPHRDDPPLRLPRRRRVRLSRGRAARRARLRRAEVDGEPGLRGDAEGGDGRRRRAPPRGRLRAGPDRRHPRRAGLRRRRPSRW